MKRKKRNSVFTFIFSWIPGAAEMYTGYMKTGLSLLSVFAAGCLIPYLMHASDVWILLPMVLYIYSFFHARNIASLNDEELSRLDDHYIWDEFTDDRETVLSSGILRKWGAVILIILGILALWNNFRTCAMDVLPDNIADRLYPVLDFIPSTVFAILIVIIGIILIRGRKKELNEDAASAEQNDTASVSENGSYVSGLLSGEIPVNGSDENMPVFVPAEDIISDGPDGTASPNGQGEADPSGDTDDAAPVIEA